MFKMKKIINILILLFSIVSFAQDAPKDTHQFTMNFSFTEYKKDGEVLKSYIEASRLYFNYQNTPGRFKLYLGQTLELDLLQTEPTIIDKTKSGQEYFGFMCTDQNDSVMFIQVFKDNDYGVRLIDEGDIIVTLYSE